jgi:hypothetical protein
LARLESVLLRTVEKFESSSALMTRIDLRAVHAVVGMAIWRGQSIPPPELFVKSRKGSTFPGFG